MGWLPKDRYKGKPENWIPADKYLERGEAILPILQANNRDLATSVTRMETENTQLKQQLKDASEAIEGLKEFRSTLAKERAQEQKREITTAIVQARKDGDVDAEVTLTEKLGEVTAAITEAAKPAPKKPDPAAAITPQLTAEAQQWMKENPWFGTDQRKTGYVAGLRAEWLATGKPLTSVSTPEFFTFVDTELAKMFDPNAERRGTQKVDGTNNSSGGDESGGKTYADLPPEAKKECDRMAAKVVGPNKAYKDKAAWQAVYLSQFDWS
jgi:hypothetical protein